MAGSRVSRIFIPACLTSKVCSKWGSNNLKRFSDLFFANRIHAGFNNQNSIISIDVD